MQGKGGGGSRGKNWSQRDLWQLCEKSAGFFRTLVGGGGGETREQRGAKWCVWGGREVEDGEGVRSGRRCTKKRQNVSANELENGG